MPRSTNPTDTSPGQVSRAMARLARVWRAPALTRVPVVFHRRLSRTLARVVLRPLVIQLNPIALASPHRIEVITHEAAHAALALAGEANGVRPHGPEWRRLMALAGFPDARATRARTCLPRPPTRKAGTRHQHRCPVCQTTRTAKRPVPQWRCAACTAAGLEGRLVIQRKGRPG